MVNEVTQGVVAPLLGLYSDEKGSYGTCTIELEEELDPKRIVYTIAKTQFGDMVDFLILSNSNHDKLNSSSFNLELSQFLPPIIVDIKDQKCIQLKTYTRGNIWFASYKC